MELSGYIVLNSLGHPIDLDEASGGYPVQAYNTQCVHFWKEDEARRYVSMFEGYTVRKAKLVLVIED